jgi:hypothetical protein
MTTHSGKTRIRRRGALLLILSSLAVALPLTGREAMQAHADDGGDSGSGNGGSGGGSGGSGSGGGSDDGGSDDGGDDGGDDGDSDNGGSGSGSSGGGRGNGGSQGSKSGNQQQGQSNAKRDGALAAQLKGRIAPIGEVESIAGKTIPGEIIDVRLYRNKDLYVYKVKIIQRSGSIYDVRIDATTRKVLSARER